MNIEIKNCNNIETANIEIVRGKLNIKFAPNGTGKTTIAKALVLGAAGQPLDDLTSFKHRNTEEVIAKPQFSSNETIGEVKCFNEDYVDQFVFKQDELLANSFDVFVRTPTFRAAEEAIEKIVADLKSLFVNDVDLNASIDTFKELHSNFKLTGGMRLSRSSLGMKGLATGNKLLHIPEGLDDFQSLIQGEKNIEWLDWHHKGRAFIDVAETCPFCTSSAKGKRDQIAKLDAEYDKTTIKNLKNILEIIEKLGHLLSDDAREKLAEIATLQSAIQVAHQAFLVEVVTQIETLLKKLEDLKSISSYHFKNGETVSGKLPLFKIDLTFLGHLNSPKNSKTVCSLNEQLDLVIAKAGELQGKINIQNSEISQLVGRHQTEINEFLEYAGYQYQVKLDGDDGLLQLKLFHRDNSEQLLGGKQHLSFGERNAFAIVLFMYECLAKPVDVIVLDDPISSFDKNKKYAILHMLFRRDSACLKGKTVLMFTHC